MSGLPPHSSDGSPLPARRSRLHGLWDAARVLAGGPRRQEIEMARILDLFEEYVYAGEITAGGRYVHHASMSTSDGLLGGPTPQAAEVGQLWESRIAPADWPKYEAFNRSLLAGEDAEATYRLIGLDGVTRIVRDRARPRPLANGNVLIQGIISDVTAREEAAARLDEASNRFSSLLDVVGAHVYLALA